MKSSHTHVRTTHVGRLGHPDHIFDPMVAQGGRPAGDPRFSRSLRASVSQVVEEQAALGLDIVNDGELGKLGWQVYFRDRLAGFTVASDPGSYRPFTKSGRDAQQFAAYFEASSDSWVMRRVSGALRQANAIVCTAPVTYVGQGHLQEDIDNLLAALAAAGKDPADGFMNAISPDSVRARNSYYGSDEEYLFAVAAALSEEYRAIVAAGLTLQVDSPYVAVRWAEHEYPTVSEYYAWADVRVEALNFALRGIPPDRVRVHVCWGSYRGPHTTDLPMADLIPLALRMRVGAWAIEAANARHEHEFAAWQGVDLGGRVLVPGVVSHVTDTVEHPDLVAWRIKLWCDAVGAENIIAGTDCGLGDRLHPQIERAKLGALVEGARRASG